MQDFKQKCLEFYDWFEKEESSLSKLMDSNEFEKATSILAEQLKRVLQEVVFQMYKPTNQKRYIVELSTYSDNSKKIVFRYFCELMPPSLKNKWEFNYYHHAYHGSVNLNGLTFDGDSLNAYVSVDEKKRRFDVAFVRNKDLKTLSDKDSYMLLYMMLVDYIGELTVEAYIGSISYSTKLGNLLKKHSTLLSVREIYQFINDTCVKQNWDLPKDITLIADNYNIRNKNHDERKDIFQGATYCLDLLNDEDHSTHPLIEYILSCGVLYYTIIIKKDFQNETKNTIYRNNLEKEVNAILDKGGMVVNNARGNHRDYLDLFIFENAKLSEIENLIDHKKDTCSLKSIKDFIG